MIQNLPVYISVIFGLTTLLALIIFYYSIANSESDNAAGNARNIVSACCFWLVMQAILGLNEFYSADTTGFVPRFALALVPPFLTILIVFSTKKGLIFIDTLSLEDLTYLSVVRVPVELVLYWLFLHKAVPQLMTFAGKNFDILAGISAPLVGYFGFSAGKLSSRFLFYWNFLSLLLLLNVLIIGILSGPFAFQRFSFLQPDTAVLYFPFVWLPSFIVPLVLFCHLVSMRQLSRSFSQRR